MMSKFTFDRDSVAPLIVLLIALALVVGWFLNIYKITQGALDGWIVARVIGVFLMPIGGFLGWF